MGYTVNIQKSKAFLYTNNEISQTEIGPQKNHFKVAIGTIKYLGINLTKEVKKCTQNYATQKKEIKEDTN